MGNSGTGLTVTGKMLAWRAAGSLYRLAHHQHFGTAADVAHLLLRLVELGFC